MDLVTPRFPSAAVTDATDGYASPSIQRNWFARGFFSVPIPEPRAGKPRQFPLLAVYEAETLAWAARRGVLSAVRDAWFWRKNDIGGSGPGIVADDDLLTGAINGRLPEFQSATPPKDFFWAILLEPDQDDVRGSGPLVGTWDEIGPAVFGKDREGAFAVNISAVMRNVGRRLSAAGHAL